MVGAQGQPNQSLLRIALVIMHANEPASGRPDRGRGLAQIR